MMFTNRAAGFSLVELMIALVLGLLLTASVLQLFSGSKQTYSTNESLARVQENIRFTMDVIQEDVRGAMSFGFCAARPVVHSHLNLAPWQETIFRADSEVMGWEFAGTAPGDDPYEIAEGYPAGNSGDWQTRVELIDGSIGSFGLPDFFSQSSSVHPVAGSDILVVRRARPVPELTSDGGSWDLTEPTISLNGTHELQNRLLLVTDCNSADLFRNVSTNASELSRAAAGSACGQCPGNNSAGQWRTQILSPTMQVYEMQVTAYFVGFNQERGEPGLYRLDVSGCPCGNQPEEMVDGVENMQLVFGVSPATSVGGTFVNDDAWMPADQVIDKGWWWQVIGARVGILHRSRESAGLGSIQQEFDLVGTSAKNASDARLRQDGVTTLSFRNRVVTDSGVSDG